jgi:hypothetical protein
MFDEQTIENQLVASIYDHHLAVLEHMTATLKHSHAVGELLLKARDSVPSWPEWIKDRIEFGSEIAEKYIEGAGQDAVIRELREQERLARKFVTAMRSQDSPSHPEVVVQEFAFWLGAAPKPLMLMLQGVFANVVTSLQAIQERRETPDRLLGEATAAYTLIDSMLQEQARTIN